MWVAVSYLVRSSCSPTFGWWNEMKLVFKVREAQRQNAWRYTKVRARSMEQWHLGRRFHHLNLGILSKVMSHMTASRGLANLAGVPPPRLVLVSPVHGNVQKCPDWLDAKREPCIQPTGALLDVVLGTLDEQHQRRGGRGGGSGRVGWAMTSCHINLKGGDCGCQPPLDVGYDWYRQTWSIIHFYICNVGYGKLKREELCFGSIQPTIASVAIICRHPSVVALRLASIGHKNMTRGIWPLTLEHFKLVVFIFGIHLLGSNQPICD